MGLNIRHGILSAPAGTVGLSAPPPNAGLLPGVTRTAYAGPMTITTAGTVISNKNFTQAALGDYTLFIRAINVTVSNCYFTGPSYFAVDSDANGTIIDHCLIESGNWGANSCFLLTGQGWQGTNNKLTGADNGLAFGGSGLLQGNYLYHLGGRPEAHVDGMQTTGCNDVQIIGNWVESWDTSDIILKCDGGPINNVLIEGNTLICDPVQGLTSAAIYAASVGTNLCRNVTIRRNLIQKSYYNFYVATSDDSFPVLDGNIDYITRAPITSYTG